MRSDLFADQLLKDFVYSSKDSNRSVVLFVEIIVFLEDGYPFLWLMTGSFKPLIYSFTMPFLTYDVKSVLVHVQLYCQIFFYRNSNLFERIP